MDKMGSQIKAAHCEPRSVILTKHPFTDVRRPMDRINPSASGR